MKKTLIFISSFLLSLIFTFSSALAQKANSVNINVNARVIESIELVTIRNMRFGNIQPGQKEIDIPPITDANAGKMVAKGIPNARIRVSYIKEWQLSNDQNNEKLTFIYDLAGNTVDNQSTAELLKTDNRGLQFNKDGEYYLWIGGIINIQDAQPGNYEGEFTIEIEYM